VDAHAGDGQRVALGPIALRSRLDEFARSFRVRERG